jgi:hypothetical protein
MTPSSAICRERLTAAYGIGIVAAFWVVERLDTMFLG